MLLKKILIVDDSRTARMMIIQSLMKFGLEDSLFVEAENGLKASDIIRREKFDLIITDILMPKMDGSTFIQKTRVFPENRETPIIILSSLGEQSLAQSLEGLKHLYFIQKPLEENSLSTILGEIDERRI